ncbi:histidine phosphatase family protein [Enterococcus sp. LJL90]
MKLYLIRHGETDWNVASKIQGKSDIPLNANGQAQAEQLAEKLAANPLKFSKIYSSPLKRAVATADILSQQLKLGLIVAEGLKEINLGVWEGFTWPEVAEKYPLEYRQWYENRRRTRPPAGESYQDLLDRLLPTLVTIIGENSQDVALVTHSAVIMTLESFLHDTPFAKMGQYKNGNTGITEVSAEMLLTKVR